MIPVIVLLAMFAPAPLPRKPQPPMQVEPGDYILHWGHAQYEMYLNSAGGYNVPPAWRGNWKWCEKTRTLTIQESCEGGELRQWSVVLDAKLKGTANYWTCFTDVRLERKTE